MYESVKRSKFFYDKKKGKKKDEEEQNGKRIRIGKCT